MIPGQCLNRLMPGDDVLADEWSSKFVAELGSFRQNLSGNQDFSVSLGALMAQGFPDGLGASSCPVSNAYVLQ